MRRQFGPQYDRLARKLGSSRKADAELTARQRRVEALGIRPLSPERQARYSGDWAAIQERFVDAPAEAVAAADALIWDVMRDRGYPADDRNASMEALSVYHARLLDGYLRAQEVRTDSATTEQLREAMIRHRALFQDLTGLTNGRGRPDRDRVAEVRARAAENSAVTTGHRDLIEENRDLPAERRDLAAEDIDRTADTPR
jgi:hypothetical protein